ncbi:MAG: hypothetical protein M3356_06795, partial [Actinomycetota bacterium]|nr:hypothetical protein [Actinomycetota bacterium]
MSINQSPRSHMQKVSRWLRERTKRRRDDPSVHLERVRAELAGLARGDGPVLAGPFMGEVGFELLYWLPFVRWAVEQEPGLRGRLVLVSRGGTASWAADLDAAGYVDVLSLISPEELVRRRPSLKQREVSALDEELLAAVRDHLGVGDPGVLHPSLLFDLYYRMVKHDRRAFAAAVAPTEDGARGLAASYRPIAPPGPLPEAGLPDEYVAVRFYGRASLPASAENQELVRRLVANLADKVPVVLLGHDLELDDHSDIGAGRGERILSVAHLMRPADNLEVQTRVLAGARGFVGTYGGLSYLAPSLGLPSLALTSTLEGLRPWHLDLAQQ